MASSPLVPDTTNIANALMQIFAQRDDREDRQAFQVEQQQKQAAALEAQRRFKVAGAQAASLLDKPFVQQRTGAARLAQQAILEGGDPESWERLLNISDPDEMNLALRQMAIAASDGEQIINNALGGAGAVQFGAQETFKDTAGNLYFGTTQRDPQGRTVKSVLAPIGNAPAQPVGEVKLVSALGLTDKETVEHKGQVAAVQEKSALTEQLQFKPQIEAAVAEARASATERGEAFTELNQAEAALPGLEVAVGKLRELAQVATHTTGGRIFDLAVKELGFGATKGATARAKFIAIVNNQVLPLLKPTFGSAFTESEGEALKATMGDPNATPEEKMAQLDAFLEQKIRDIQTKKARIEEKPGSKAAPTKVLRFDAQGNLIK